jgi:ABC-2 type transport system ATP-binding protein
VIYASHYMEEVEALCQRVAIIDHGKLLALGTLDELIGSSHADVSLRVAASAVDLNRRLLGLADVVATNGHESRAIIKRERKGAAGVVARRLAKVLDVLADAGVEILSIENRQQNLEFLFLERTGRKLRD